MLKNKKVIAENGGRQNELKMMVENDVRFTKESSVNRLGVKMNIIFTFLDAVLAHIVA